MAGGEESRNRWFVAEVLPHRAAAYNLARWMTRNEADAGDVIQEAFARVLQYFDSYHGGDVRSWLLSIVRNTAYTWLNSNPPPRHTDSPDSLTTHSPEDFGNSSDGDPSSEVISQDEAKRLRRAVARLPLEYREILVLREFEDLSYRQIATVVGCPIGTVMSRLSRARDELGERLRLEAQPS
jgi:RNA polymerase sigma-70 factor (ECF subfamily)